MRQDPTQRRHWKALTQDERQHACIKSVEVKSQLIKKGDLKESACATLITAQI